MRRWEIKSDDAVVRRIVADTAREAEAKARDYLPGAANLTITELPPVKVTIIELAN